MKTIYVFVCLILSVQFLYGQEQAPEEFEGYIEFVHTVSYTDSTADIKKAKERFGTSSVYYYKNGCYKWVFKGRKNIDGNETLTEMYSPIRNEVFITFTGNSPAVRPGDPQKHSQVLSFKYIFEKDSLAGFPCNQFFIETAYGDINVKRFFSYSDRLPLNPEHFSHFSHNNFDFIYPKIKAVPLDIKVIMDDYFIMEYKAVKVVKKQLDPAMFEWPDIKDHDKLKGNNE
ncbi:hypothetical protein [Chitinophaga sp. HK235]|uniref:hypothetical protein n=1 Tax=Chitinophaga sp. HK235 TaxID=2952571 RepID=UPI001BA713B1|nr:hypothetical protein [Chitinophaga sp. HK235]